MKSVLYLTLLNPFSDDKSLNFTGMSHLIPANLKLLCQAQNFILQNQLFHISNHELFCRWNFLTIKYAPSKSNYCRWIFWQLSTPLPNPTTKHLGPWILKSISVGCYLPPSTLLFICQSGRRNFLVDENRGCCYDFFV